MRRTTSVAAGVAHLVGPGSLKVGNGHLAFTPQGQPPLRLDPAALTAVTCYGDVSVTAAARGGAVPAEHPGGVADAGRHPLPGAAGADRRADHADARFRQHRAFAPGRRPAGVGAAGGGGEGRRRWRRPAGTSSATGSAAAGPLMVRLAEYADRVPGVLGVESLLGLEGAASAAWFEFFATLLVPPWSSPGRIRRPPTDPTNALLSLVLQRWLS